MDHRSPNFIFRHCLPMTFTMDDSEWVNSEKEACSASFSYWAANGKSTGWNWPLGWKRSHEENRHLLTPFLGIFYPTLKKNEIGDDVFGGCSMLPVRKTVWQLEGWGKILWKNDQYGNMIIGWTAPKNAQKDIWYPFQIICSAIKIGSCDKTTL